MPPFGLSLFDTGLILVIIVLTVLYLIVLIKLKPSTEGERIPNSDLSKLKTGRNLSTERGSNSISSNEIQEEPLENSELVSPAYIETEETETSQEARPSGCPYHFGYLKEHPKNTPVPNECFTCTKIMECLLGAE